MPFYIVELISPMRVGQIYSKSKRLMPANPGPTRSVAVFDQIVDIGIYMWLTWEYPLWAIFAEQKLCIYLFSNAIAVRAKHA